MKINFKSICKTLNAHAEAGSYDKPATLRVEYTSFQPMHKAHRGRNGVGELVELVTQVIDTKAIHVAMHERSSLISVYLQADTKLSHGFCQDGGTFLRIRDAKGKYHSFETSKSRDRSETNVNGFLRAIGEATPSLYAPEEFEAFKEEKASKVVKLVGDESNEGDSRWMRDRQVREFAEKFYQELAMYHLDHETHGLDKLLAFAGCKLVTMFRFTDRFWFISPDYVESTSKGLEIGWTHRSTYNSLPETLRITKTREIKTVKLSDIGVETSGYYNHGDRMRVLPGQVQRSRRFAARFRAKQKKVTAQVLTNARKAG